MTSTNGLAAAPFADWRHVGEARGYAYYDRIAAPKLPGSLFADGTDVVAHRVLDALTSPSPFLAGSLTATFGEAHTRVSTSFIAIPLARSVPDCVLLNARSGAFRDAGISMGSRQLLRLEGDFDRAYSLYGPMGGSDQALGVFTPQLMRLFLSGSSNSDIETVDDWMFIYGRANRDSSATMLDTIETVARNVGSTINAPFIAATASDDARTEPAVPRRTSRRSFTVITAVGLAVGGLLTWWGMLHY